MIAPSLSLTPDSGVLVMTGAGISAESGVPTFRGAGGYWRNHDPRKLATREAFERDPRLIWEWYRERRRLIAGAQPNAAHVAVTRLGLHCRDFLLVTQNVDDLHQRAEWQGRRLPAEKIVQIHGDIWVSRCMRCDFQRRDSNASVMGAEPPHCPICGALLRPGVVWFDEELPLPDVQRTDQFLRDHRCDLSLVIGTTAVFDYIVHWARTAASSGALIEINPEETPLSTFARERVRYPAAGSLPDLVEKWIA